MKFWKMNGAGNSFVIFDDRKGVLGLKPEQIKAIANLGKQRDSVYTEDLNYGIGKATEPGSVFKLATLMSFIKFKIVAAK